MTSSGNHENHYLLSMIFLISFIGEGRGGKGEGGYIHIKF